MSYLVLARKYRPITFAQLVGQDHVVRTLANAISLGRVHHAFLFTGARGVGKTTTARLLARALNCEAGASITPCGTCSACVELLKHTAADVLEIDGASNNGVDSVRELREAVRYLPAKMRFKLYIIDEVHMLSQAAFNALLKTLEEPPPHVKFIFATTEPHKIPVTILSRCQRFDFRRVGLSQLMAHLRDILAQESISLGSESLNQIARQADGSVRDALSLLDQVLSYAGDAPSDELVLQALGAIDRKTIAALCDAVLARDASALLDIVQDIEIRGHDLAEAASLFSEHLRDVAVAKYVQEHSRALPERSADEIAALKIQAGRRSHSDWQRLFVQAVLITEDTRRSHQPKVSFEMGLLRLLDVAPTVDLDSLLSRVDNLLAAVTGSQTLPQTTAETGDKPVQSAPGLKAAAADTADKGAAPNTPEEPAANCLRAADEKASEPPAGACSNRDIGGGFEAHASPPPALAHGASQPAKAAPPSPDEVRPASQSAAEPLEAAADAAHTAWRHFVERVRQKRPALASVLEHGRLLAFGPGGVELAYAAQTFYWDAATDDTNRALLLELLTKQFEKAVSLRIVDLQHVKGAQPTLAQAQQLAREAAVNTVQERARQHQAVRSAVTILGGEVQNICALSPGA